MICNLQIWYFIAMLDDCRVVRIDTYTRFYGLLIVAWLLHMLIDRWCGISAGVFGRFYQCHQRLLVIYIQIRVVYQDVTPLGVFQSHGTICPVWWSLGFCSVLPMLLIRSFHLLNSLERYMTWQYNDEATTRKLSTITFGNGLLVDFALATSQNPPTECEVISVCTCCILFLIKLTWSVGWLVR